MGTSLRGPYDPLQSGLDVTDPATQKYEFQMKECHLPIIPESEFRAVQKEKKKRSNVIMDDDGTRRSSKKYSSKRK